MPLPLIIAGLTGAIGVGAHVTAQETNEQAQNIYREAEKLYNESKDSLDKARNTGEESLKNLGYTKEEVLDTSIKQFLTYYKKVKDIKLEESDNINEISKFTIDEQGVLQLRELTDIYSSSLSTGAKGAAAGVAVALAASGTFPELAAAGTALASGEIGMAGAALNFTEAVTPLSVIVAPIIAFTGIKASMDADENLEKAKTTHAEVEEAIEKMRIQETIFSAVSNEANMYNDLLVELNNVFAKCSGLMAGVIKKKEGRIFKKKLNRSDFTDDEIKLICVTRSLVGAVKSIIDTPILDKNGMVSDKAKSNYEKFHCLNEVDSLQKVYEANYKVRPVVIKSKKNTRNKSKVKKNRGVVINVMRNIIAVLIAFGIAFYSSKFIAIKISSVKSSLSFLKPLIANTVAIWLIILFSVAMLIGKFKGRLFEKMAVLGSLLGIAILFMQYVTTVSTIKHNIIISIMFCIIIFGISDIFDKAKDKGQFALFYSLEFQCISMWGSTYLLYAFLTDFIGFPQKICFIFSTVLFFLVEVGAYQQAYKTEPKTSE